MMRIGIEQPAVGRIFKEIWTQQFLLAKNGRGSPLIRRRLARPA